MASRKVTYGFGHIIDIILAIFVIPNIILGIIKRAERKNWLGVILNIVLAPFVALVDLVTIILYDELKVLV